MQEQTDVEAVNLRSVTDVLPHWNRHDVNGVLTFYDDAIVWHNVALEETYEGKTEVGAFLARLFDAFPDLSFEVTQKIADGDRVAEQWTIRGTHLGPFMGVPATHRGVEILGMSMVRMRDGKFLRDDFYFDASGVLRQMGLLPSLAATQSPVGRALLWAAVNRVLVAAGLVAATLLGVFVGRRRGE